MQINGTSLIGGKKTTDMGSKSKFFGFRTEDGTTIDVDKIKNWGGKKEFERYK